MEKGKAIELMHYIGRLTDQLDWLTAAMEGFPASDPDFNRELHKSLFMAQANLIRWRPTIGEEAGLVIAMPTSTIDDGE